MHHLFTISFGKAENKPYHGECSCGTGGDFGSNQEARDYAAGHLTRLQGINSGGFVDNTVSPAPVPPPEQPAQEEKKQEPAPAPAPVEVPGQPKPEEKQEPKPEEKAEAAG